MLILGIILIILGLSIFKWSVNAQSKTKITERPQIINRAHAVTIINLICASLFIGGFYSLWQVSPEIVLAIIISLSILLILVHFIGLSLIHI